MVEAKTRDDIHEPVNLSCARLMWGNQEHRFMPHIVVKLWPGRTEQQKKRLTEAITRDVSRIFDLDDGYISIAFEEIEADDWDDKVY